MKIKQQRPAEVLYPRIQPLQNLRPAARLSSQIRNLPYLLPGACLQGRNPGREKGQLVKLSKGGNGMQITDTIADLLTRIRNANSAKHDSVEIPASNMKKAICQILLDEGYIKSFTVTRGRQAGHHQGNAEIRRGQDPRHHRACAGCRKPGLRIYSSCEDTAQGHEGPRHRHHFHHPSGVMTDRRGPQGEHRRRSSGVHLVSKGVQDMSRIGRKPINIPAGVDGDGRRQRCHGEGPQGHPDPDLPPEHDHHG